LLDLRAGRGCAFGDVDNDGDIDIVVNNVNQTMDLYRQDRNNDNHWTTIQLAAAHCNRSAIGARVRIVAGSITQIDEVRSGGSYYSQNDFRLHFGLGQANKIDLLEVRWPDGKIDTHRDVAVDRMVKIEESK
jgi:hypothetical protein